MDIVRVVHQIFVALEICKVADEVLALFCNPIAAVRDAATLLLRLLLSFHSSFFLRLLPQLAAAVAHRPPVVLLVLAGRRRLQVAIPAVDGRGRRRRSGSRCGRPARPRRPSPAPPSALSPSHIRGAASDHWQLCLPLSVLSSSASCKGLHSPQREDDLADLPRLAGEEHGSLPQDSARPPAACSR